MCENSDEVLGNGELVVINCAPNTNLMNPETKMKAMKYAIPVGETSIVTEFIYSKVR